MVWLTNINCIYNKDRTFCTNKEVKRSLLGLGKRICCESDCQNVCPFKIKFSEVKTKVKPPSPWTYSEMYEDNDLFQEKLLAFNKNKFKVIDSVIEEYLIYKYPELYKIIGRVNNFKMKGDKFRSITYKHNMKTDFYDEGFCFLTLVQGEFGELSINKHWNT